MRVCCHLSVQVLTVHCLFILLENQVLVPQKALVKANVHSTLVQEL